MTARYGYHDVLSGLVPFCVDTADCTDVMRSMPSQCFDMCITDPPYGIMKDTWDVSFDIGWIHEVARVTRKAIIVIPGLDNIAAMPHEFGDFQYVWTFAGVTTNNMARGRLGFGNWIPAMLYARKGLDEKLCLKQIKDVVMFPITQRKLGWHPTPKPLVFMEWLVSRFDAETVFDPFCGSGTTGIACLKHKRRFYGIEIDETYASLCNQRLSAFLAQRELGIEE